MKTYQEYLKDWKQDEYKSTEQEVAFAAGFNAGIERAMEIMDWMQDRGKDQKVAR